MSGPASSKTLNVQCGEGRCTSRTTAAPSGPRTENADSSIEPTGNSCCHLPPGSLARGEQPVLDTGGGLVLRPWRADDAAAVVAGYSDPAIRHWHARTMNDSEAMCWIAHWARRWRQENGCGWAITDADGVVGQISFRTLNLERGSAEISCWVLPHARGGRIALDAVTTVSEWSFNDVGLHRLEVNHSMRNPTPCRVAERAGFIAEGVKRGEALHADGWHDIHVHARLASDPS